MARAIGPEQYGAISFLDLFFSLEAFGGLDFEASWESWESCALRNPWSKWRNQKVRLHSAPPGRRLCYELPEPGSSRVQNALRGRCLGEKKNHVGRLQSHSNISTKSNKIELYIYIDFTRSPDSFGLFELGLLNHLTRPSKYTEISRCAWNIFRYLCTCWSVVCTCVSMAEVMQPVANSSETSALTSVKGALITRGISVRLAWLTGWEQNGLQ